MNKENISVVPHECMDTDGDGVEDRVDLNPNDNRIKEVNDIEELEKEITGNYSILDNLKEKEEYLNSYERENEKNTKDLSR